MPGPLDHCETKTTGHYGLIASIFRKNDLIENINAMRAKMCGNEEIAAFLALVKQGLSDGAEWLYLVKEYFSDIVIELLSGKIDVDKFLARMTSIYDNGVVDFFMSTCLYSLFDNELLNRFFHKNSPSSSVTSGKDQEAPESKHKPPDFRQRDKALDVGSSLHNRTFLVNKLINSSWVTIVPELFTVSGIAIPTLLMGLIPIYESVSYFAPVVVTIARFLQGIFVGGEYDGAAIFLSEHTGDSKLGFSSLWMRAKGVLSLQIGSLMTLIFTYTSPDLWSLMFFVSISLMVATLFYRRWVHGSRIS